MKKLFSAIVATVAVFALAQAQQQTSVKVDGKDYTVTEYQGGRPGHMVSLTGPDGTAMVSVNNKNEIVAFISPPGGIAPNGSDYKPLVNQVWKAYLGQKNQAAAPAAVANAPAAEDDPRAVLRAQMATLSGNLPGGNVGRPAKPSVEFPAAGGAIVKGTSFGDITYSADGTEARAVQRSSSPITGDTTIELVARYKGGEHPGEGKTAGVVTGGLRTLAESANVRAKGEVNTRGNDVIVVSQSTNGKKRSRDINNWG